jgi:hypothetical protein
MFAVGYRKQFPRWRFDYLHHRGESNEVLIKPKVKSRIGREYRREKDETLGCTRRHGDGCRLRGISRRERSQKASQKGVQTFPKFQTTQLAKGAYPGGVRWSSKF